MKRIATLAASALIVAAALLQPAAAQDVVRLGTTPEPYPPFINIDPNGKLSGFEIELAEAVCAEAKVKCEWVLQAWEGIIPALLEKKFDAIVASMSITDERRQVVDFSGKYYDSPAMFVGRKDQDIDITAESLNGKTIAVQVSTIHANYLESKFKDVATIKSYDTQENANLDLIAGRVDLVLADSIALEDGLLKTADGADFERKGDTFTDKLMGEGVGFAVRKEDTALRDKLTAAIAGIRANGTYKSIADKYFSFDIYGN